jgi:type IV pilus assembly protein PilM
VWQLVRKKLVAIDIGNSRIHILAGKQTGETIEVSKALTCPTPQNSFYNGSIENEASVLEAVKNVLVKSRIHTKHVVLTVQSSGIVIREIELPSSHPENLKEMVRFEMEQYLQNTKCNYIIEFKVLERIEPDIKNKYRVRAAAMPEDMVKQYYNLLKQLKLNPVALDIHSNSVSKLFSTNSAINGTVPEIGKTYAFIDSGSKTTSVYIFSGKNMHLSREIPMGGRELDTSISSELDISLEEAERLKIEKSDISPEVQITAEDKDIEDNDGMMAVVKGVLVQLTDEIEKVFQYYTSRYSETQIDTIFLFGGNSKMNGYREYLEQRFDIRTELIRSIGSIKPSNKLRDFDCCLQINAAGAMLRY